MPQASELGVLFRLVTGYLGKEKETGYGNLIQKEALVRMY